MVCRAGAARVYSAPRTSFRRGDGPARKRSKHGAQERTTAASRSSPRTGRPGTSTRSSTRWEAGLVLLGTEVKALRAGRVQPGRRLRRDPRGRGLARARCTSGPTSMGNRENHEPFRRRKLLLNRREIRKLSAQARGAGPDPGAAEVLLQAGPGEGRAGPGPRQEAARQARRPRPSRMSTGASPRKWAAGDGVEQRSTAEHRDRTAPAVAGLAGAGVAAGRGLSATAQAARRRSTPSSIRWPSRGSIPRPRPCR